MTARSGITRRRYGRRPPNRCCSSHSARAGPPDAARRSRSFVDELVGFRLQTCGTVDRDGDIDRSCRVRRYPHFAKGVRQAARMFCCHGRGPIRDRIRRGESFRKPIAGDPRGAPFVPPGVLTVTSTVPATSRAGERAATSVPAALMKYLLAGTPPNSTTPARLRFVPVIVTALSPVAGPEVADTLVTVGA